MNPKAAIPHLNRSREFLVENYRRPLTLEDLASEIGYSPFYLQRQFREAFGETPTEFVQSLRLREAHRLLSRTDTPVNEVCLEIGYQSPPTFSALFARRYGTPPQSYRRSFAFPGIWQLRQIPRCFLGDLRKIG